MKKIAIIAMAALGLAAAGTTQADEALAKKAGCLTCHNVTGAKKLGPSLHDASVKNAGDEAKILAVLNDKKKHGSIKANDDEKKTLARLDAGEKYPDIMGTTQVILETIEKHRQKLQQ